MLAASSRRLPRPWLVASLLLLVIAALLVRSRAAQLFVPAQRVPTSANFPLCVVDQQGRPIAAFGVEAALNGDNGSQTAWSAGKDGQARLTSPSWDWADLRTIDLAVHGDGFAPVLVHYPGGELEQLRAGQAQIALEPGEEVELALRLPPEMDWPAEGQPYLYFDRLKGNVRHAWSIREDSLSQPTQRVVNQLGAVWVKPGLAQLRLGADTAPFRVAVNIPGFLRLFETPPLTLSDFQDGRLEIDVPRPASLLVQFDPGEVEEDSLLFDRALLRVMWPTREGPGATTFAADQRVVSAPWLPLKLGDLAPGNYRVRIQTMPFPGVKNLPTGARPPLNPGVFTEIETVALAPGDSKEVRAIYAPLDLEAFRGDRTAVLHVLKPDGSPAAGESIQVVYHAEHYSGLPVFSGTVPDSGTLTIGKITAHAPVVTNEPYTVWHKPPDDSGKRRSNQVGNFGFSSDRGAEEFTFYLEPDQGDQAPDAELVNLGSGKGVKLSDFRGRLVLLEFWATWCGPCREPVRELNRWIVERQAAWKGHVAILPVSIDADLDELKGHLAQNGWDESNFYWCRGRDPMSAAEKAFVVRAVPTTLLIAPDGRILLRNPSKDDLEGAIAKALAD